MDQSVNAEEVDLVDRGDKKGHRNQPDPAVLPSSQPNTW